MRKLCVRTVLGLLTLGSAGNAGAAVTQIGDFRIGATAVSSSTAYNTFSFATRSVVGAPVQVNSTFAGVSQNNDAAAPDVATDIALQTYSSVTTVRTIARYDTPVGTGTASGPTTAGGVSWNFDLTPVASYLSTSGQTLNGISLLLSTAETAGATVPFDVYLSYTQPAAGLTQTGLSTNQSTNYSALFAPGHAAAVGATVNSSFVVLAKGQTTADLTGDLTALYNGGVRQFTLLAVAGNFGQARALNIGSTAAGLASGLYLDTTATPEPATLGGLAVAGIVCLRRRRA